jgi:hypothetical protein
VYETATSSHEISPTNWFVVRPFGKSAFQILENMGWALVFSGKSPSDSAA